MEHNEELRYLLIITRYQGYKIMGDKLGWEWSMHVRDDQNAYKLQSKNAKGKDMQDYAYNTGQY